MMERRRINPLVLVISGPSGVGKDAVIASLKKSVSSFHYVVTATTRLRRSAEINGVDYYFFTQEEFFHKVKKDEFLESAEVYGNYYGVLKKEIHDALLKGETTILKVDVQGAATLKKKIPDAVFIFLMPPSIQELIERLEKRNTESVSAINSRVKQAEEEIKCLPMFDYLIVNHKDDLKRTTDTIWAIVAAEQSRVKQRQIKL